MVSHFRNSFQDWAVESSTSHSMGRDSLHEFSSSSCKSNIIFLVSGGGRKNRTLINCIKNNLNNKNKINLKIIEDYNLNGDYIESQAFGFLAIRSFLNLPISFNSTTGCEGFTVGGKLEENF